MNIQKLMKQAQQAQVQMAKLQEDIAQESFEASAGGGMVKVVIKGDQTLESVKIDPAAVDPEEVDLLEDMIVAAVNEASRVASDKVNAKMAELTGGMNIPGLM